MPAPPPSSASQYASLVPPPGTDTPATFGLCNEGRRRREESRCIQYHKCSKRKGVGLTGGARLPLTSKRVVSGRSVLSQRTADARIRRWVEANLFSASPLRRARRIHNPREPSRACLSVRNHRATVRPRCDAQPTRAPFQCSSGFRITLHHSTKMLKVV